MPAFIWPNRHNPGDGMAVRTGRVAHWIAAGFSVLAVILTFAIAAFGNSANEIISPLPAAIAVYALGRGLRYILASE